MSDLAWNCTLLDLPARYQIEVRRTPKADTDPRVYSPLGSGPAGRSVEILQPLAVAAFQVLA